MLRDALEAGAVWMNEIDINEVQAFPTAFGRGKVAVAVRGEGDPLAVGGPCGAEVAAVTGSERPGFASDWVKYPEIRGSGNPRRYEDDLAAIGGEGGLTSNAGSSVRRWRSPPSGCTR
jgi:hypothetical protein